MLLSLFEYGIVSFHSIFVPCFFLTPHGFHRPHRESVVCLYSKSGGKNGKHGAVTDVSNVATLSYVGLQVFGHSHGRWFTHIPEETAQLQTRRFALLHSSVEPNQTHLIEVSSGDIKESVMMTAQKGAIEMALEKYKDQ